MNMMFHRARTERDALNIAKEVLAAILVLLLLSAFLPAHAEEDTETDDFFGLDVILEDPEYFLFDEPEDEIPVITSVGRSNVKVAGVKSKHQLVQYTIPETLLRADENFLALMMEAENTSAIPMCMAAANLLLASTVPASCAGCTANPACMIPAASARKGSIRCVLSLSAKKPALEIWFSLRKRWVLM